MRDDRYWQVQHPERGAYAGWVTKGWQALATSPLRTAAGQSMVSVRAYERQRNGRPEHVSAHTRSGRAGQGSTAATPRPGIVPVQLGPFLLAPKPPGYIVPRFKESAEVPMRRVPGQSGKEAAKDLPDWARGKPRWQGESPVDFAKRLLNERHGSENAWNKKPADTGPRSDYNKIKKFGERAFREWIPGFPDEDDVL
ncbi:hypothetical protein [Roseomonas gilardii]|uniref:hypothetical protein n=1 Tax=Roseomonas gilardii TaxID=257708 RepID=UPI0011C038DA|nr:hypothetical protein [Roseomonas gilardii]